MIHTKKSFHRISYFFAMRKKSDVSVENVFGYENYTQFSIDFFSFEDVSVLKSVTVYCFQTEVRSQRSSVICASKILSTTMTGKKKLHTQRSHNKMVDI